MLYGPLDPKSLAQPGQECDINLTYFKRLFWLAGRGLCDNISPILLLINLLSTYLTATYGVLYCQALTAAMSSHTLTYLQFFKPNAPGVTAEFLNSLSEENRILVQTFLDSAASAAKENIFGGVYTGVCSLPACPIQPPPCWIDAGLQRDFFPPAPPGGYLTGWGLLMSQLVTAFLPVMGNFIIVFSGQIFLVRIRLVLTRWLHQELFAPGVLYKTVALESRIDNHDQRITDDLRVVMQRGLMPFVGNPGILLMLATTYANLSSGLATMQLHKPDLVPIFIILGVVMTIMALGSYAVPMNMVSRLLFAQKRYEGDLRWLHCRLVQHCEAIAFSGGEQMEEAAADLAFDRVYTIAARFAMGSAILCGLNGFFIAGVAVAAMDVLLYLGHFQPADIAFTLALDLMNGFQSALTVPAVYMSLAASGGPCHRVGELAEVLRRGRRAAQAEARARESDDPTAAPLDGRRGSLTSEISEDPAALPSAARRGSLASDSSEYSSRGPENVKPIVLKNLSVSVLGRVGMPLITGLTLNFGPGESTAIVGPSGCGKSSLLRVIAGLWSPTGGRLRAPTRRGRGGLFFVPQRPYVTPGPLRQQVTYPKAAKCTERENQRLTSLLTNVGLGYLLNEWGLDGVADWHSLLGPSDLQRLAFARLLNHRPRYALLDEATSALELDVEAKLMQMCDEAHVTCISVCHRESAIALHRRVLKLGAYEGSEGPGWQLVVPDRTPAATAVDTSIPRDENEEEGHAARPRGERPAPDEGGGMGALFQKRMRHLVKLSVPSWCGSVPGKCFLLILLTGLINGMTLVSATFFGGAFFLDCSTTPANQKYPARTPYFLAVLLAFPILIGGNTFVRAWMGQIWVLHIRRCATDAGHLSYFSPRVPYTMNKAGGELMPSMQPDQRLQQDAMQMAEYLATSFVGGSDTEGVIGTGMQVILGLIYALSLSWAGASLTVLILLVLLFISRLVQGPVVVGSVRMQQAEGVFRGAHARIREYTESIAFYGGDEVEAGRVNSLLETEVTKYGYALSVRAIPVTFVTVLLSVVSTLVPAMVLAVVVFNGPGKEQVDANSFGPAVSFFVSIGSIVTRLSAAFSQFGVVAGVVHRVGSFLEKAEEVAERVRVAGGATDLPELAQPGSEDDAVRVTDLIIHSPPRSIGGGAPVPRLLVSKVNFEVQVGRGLIIGGGSGSGKSSLLRVLAGLWAPTGGKIHRPPICRQQAFHTSKCFFLPQAPYTSNATLRDQVAYPFVADGSDDDRIREALDSVDLRYLVNRWTLDTPSEWSSHLSGGEMQRLGLARMLYHQPTFAFLDEATSALNHTLEGKCIQAMLKTGITPISVSSSGTTAKYHKQSLYLKGDNEGSWELKQL